MKILHFLKNKIHFLISFYLIFLNSFKFSPTVSHCWDLFIYGQTKIATPTKNTLHFLISHLLSSLNVLIGFIQCGKDFNPEFLLHIHFCLGNVWFIICAPHILTHVCNLLQTTAAMTKHRYICIRRSVSAHWKHMHKKYICGDISAIWIIVLHPL